MLYDQHRKRGRHAMAAVPRAPPTMRRPNAPVAADADADAAGVTTPSPPPAPLVRAHVSTTRFLEALPRHSRQTPVWRHQEARSGANAAGFDGAAFAVSRGGSTAAAVASTATSESVRDVHAVATAAATAAATETQRADVRKMIRQAHRARKLLLDRLTIVNLRRTHRCELVEEVTRLKKVLASLQEQVDTTTRNVATMDRLVTHLQSISSIFADATQLPPSAPTDTEPAITVRLILTDASSISALPIPGAGSEDSEGAKSPQSAKRLSASPRIVFVSANEDEEEQKEADAADPEAETQSEAQKKKMKTVANEQQEKGSGAANGDDGKAEADGRDDLLTSARAAAAESA